MIRGEIWELELPGSRENTPAKMQNVILLSSDSLGVLPLRIAVPIIPWLDRYSSVPWMVRVPPVLHSGLDAPAAADAMRVFSAPSAWYHRRLGELPRSIVDQIASAVSLVIEAG